ncbi:MAG TPA: hypothetical protein VF314_02585 [Actinomycetes bacterium]
MSTAFATVVRYCATCRVDGAFEQPECLDGHEVDCPEWVCVTCGDAFVVGFELPAPVPVAVPRSVA